MNNDNSSMRLYFTVFLYAEYVLRNIEYNNPDLLELVKKIKQWLKKDFPKYPAELLMDAVLECECFHHSDEYDCELFTGPILKRYESKLNRYENQVYEFDDIIGEIIRNIREDFYFSEFQKLVTCSLENGIYITHLDSFRDEGYSFDIPTSLPKNCYLQHIFFKNEKSFWNDIKHIEYTVPQYNPCDEEILEKLWENSSSIFKGEKKDFLAEEKHDRELSVYIPIFEDSFNIDTLFAQTQAIIIASRLENLETIIDNYKKYKYFIDLFFRNDIHRCTDQELGNKILGLLLWDEKRTSNKISDAIESLSKKYGCTLFKNNCGYRTCEKNVRLIMLVMYWHENCIK